MIFARRKHDDDDNDPQKNFVTRNWHNFALFTYITICLLDFILMPIYFEWTNAKLTAVQMIALVQGLKDGPTQVAALQILHDQRAWQPMTLQQNGLFHVAFGAILGVGVWSKGKENSLALQQALVNNGSNDSAPAPSGAANLSNETEMTDTDTPLNVQRHITLTVSKPLDKKEIASWFECVKNAGPSGVVSTIQTVDDEGAPRAVKLVHRTVKNKEQYVVPLSRDLLPEEVEKIVEAFVLKNGDLDFDIETNANFTVSLTRPNFSLDYEKHFALSNALAKSKHDLWMKEKMDDGWRYGPELSTENKTHPLLLPWEQLPDRYKKPDLEAPEKLMRLLNDQGYAVLPPRQPRKNVGGIEKGDVILLCSRHENISNHRTTSKHFRHQR